MSLEFRVFLVNKETGKHTQESRTLRFWFRDTPDGFDETDGATTAQDFFKELVSPQEFPRGMCISFKQITEFNRFLFLDYVGFIKKIMKLMQHNYKSIVKLEIELKQLKEPVEVPSRPRKYLFNISLSLKSSSFFL